MSERGQDRQQEAAERLEERVHEVAERARERGEGRAAPELTVRHDPTIIREPPAEDPHLAREPLQLRVIRLLAEEGSCTTPYIATRLNAPLQNVTRCCNKLADADKLVKESGAGERSGGKKGRAPTLWTLTADADEELPDAEGEEPPAPAVVAHNGRPDFGEGVCEGECGERFTKRHPRQVYCGATCREGAERERGRGSSRYEQPLDAERECRLESCDQLFVPDQPNQQYCSDQCRDEGQRASQRESMQAARRRKREPVEEPEETETPPGDAETRVTAGHQQRYLDFLFELAEKEENGRAMILDRIERLIGVPPAT